MQPYYDLASMGIARDVDPGNLPATQYMDVSRIIFQEGSNVAEDLSLGYKDTNTYCVAPVINNGTKVSSYDFWVVGINCCDPVPPARFWCGSADLADPMAHAGLRWMPSAQSHFFGLAVEQAEAEYGYHASHPMFLTWTTDPLADVESMKSTGIQFVVKCAVAQFVVQAILVASLLAMHAPAGLELPGSMKLSLS